LEVLPFRSLLGLKRLATGGIRLWLRKKKPQYNRHWYRHVLVAFSPGGIIPLLFPIWLGFPDGLVVNCYHLGMVRYFLLESCRPDDKYLLSVRDDFERKLTEEGDFYVERVMLRYWVESLVRYVRWYEEACCDFLDTLWNNY